MRRVLIGTPCHDGKVHCRWANSFGETVRLGKEIGVEVYPLYIPGNAMIHSARNEIIQQFLQSGFDDLVFIDADISWVPKDFFKLLNHSVDVVGATYAYKKNELQFVLKTLDGKVPKMEENGLMLVQGLGMGFFRLTKKAVQQLWGISEPYKRSGSEQEFRRVFDFGIRDGEEVGEDIWMCLKLPEVWLDPTIILEHSGDRQHFGNPLEWFALVEKEQERIRLEAEKEQE
jgi:glycosyltransferase involved in cell wall biosynthesis